MDHKAFLKSLSPAERAALTAQTNGAGLLRAGVHFGLILGFGFYVAIKAPLWPLALLPLGILQVFLFTLLHETVHKTPFKNDFLNAGIGRLCSVILFIPMTWFTYFHLAHHRFTNDPDKDPELAEPRPSTRSQYLWHLTGIGVWIGAAKVLWGNAFGRIADYVPDAARAKAVWEARLQLVFYASLAIFAPVWLFWIWLLPLLLGQPFLRLYLLAEHGRCPPVANMFENTRTTLTSRAIRWLAWNMPYHAEHHAYPTVPFHKLPDLHAKTKTHLRCTSDGYRVFHQEYFKATNQC